MDQKKGQITVTVGDKKVFLLSNCELKAAPSENTSADWWIRSPSQQRPVMEGSGWHKTAAERGAILRPKMRPGKVYLYQMFTTCFAEFETVDQAKMFCQYADQHIHGWNVDPVIIIDTNDPEAVKSWGNLMEGQLWR